MSKTFSLGKLVARHLFILRHSLPFQKVLINPIFCIKLLAGAHNLFWLFGHTTCHTTFLSPLAIQL